MEILKDIFGDNIEDYCEFISGTVDVVDLTTDDHVLYGASSNAIKWESSSDEDFLKFDENEGNESADMKELVEADNGCDEGNGNNREEDLFSGNKSTAMDQNRETITERRKITKTSKNAGKQYTFVSTGKTVASRSSMPIEMQREDFKRRPD